MLKVVSYHTEPTFDHWTKEVSHTNTARDFKSIANYPRALLHVTIVLAVISQGQENPLRKTDQLYH